MRWDVLNCFILFVHAQGALGNHFEAKSSGITTETVDHDALIQVEVLNHVESLENELFSLKAILAASIVKLEKAVRELAIVKRENVILRADLEELEGKVEYLEAITRKDVPRSCQDLRDIGVTKSGVYLIDPDGPGIGHAPIAAECEMNASFGSTRINHDTMSVTEIDHCEEAGCHSSRISYEASDKQLRALIDLSEECSQTISYECFVTPLMRNDENMAWWVGGQGGPNYYWDGDYPPQRHICSCGVEGTCIDEHFPCNCDSSAPEWLTDEGVLVDKDSLPVNELRFGGLLFSGQEAKFTLGPLTCAGKKEIESTNSCETLLMSGHTASGYYMVDGAGGWTHNMVKCNMNLEPTHPEFQLPTAVKIPQAPVAFDFRRRTAYKTNTTVIPYEEILLNEGGAMAKSGVFTAPMDGVYAFNFVFDEPGSSTGVEGDTVIQLRINAATIAGSIYKHGVDDDDHATSGESIIVELGKGQTVDAYLSSGGIGGSVDTHFSGHLLFPL